MNKQRHNDISRPVECAAIAVVAITIWALVNIDLVAGWVL